MAESAAPVEQATAAPGEKRNVIPTFIGPMPKRVVSQTERPGRMVVVNFDDGSQEITFRPEPS